VITAGDLVVGPIHASYRDSDPGSLLHNYLVLIRQLRDQQREPRLTLRGEDISALATHLGESEETVLGDLLDLMGATRAQRNALFSLFAAGALTIVATGSVALNLSSSGAAAELPKPATVVAELSTPAPSAPTAATPVEPEVVTAEPEMVIAEPELPIALGGAAWSDALAAAVGVADDGSTVAVAQPPVPTPEGQGVADDGSTVAVAPPPVPMPEGQGVADDGSIVAVAPPPVP
jgi:hypothetical protein